MIVKLVLTITILSVEVTQGENNDTVSILETKRSFFHKINANIHNAVNKIFNCLRLLKYFSKSAESDQLLKMHNNFLNIAEKNYVVYEHLKNATNTNFTKGDYRSKFLESLNEIIKEETTKHKVLRNKTLSNTQHNAKTEKSDESLEFLDEFVNKFSKLTIENLTNHKINETINKKNGIVKLLIKSKNYELKAWNSTFLNATQTNLTRRLYRGRSTGIKNYPFLVSIHILNDFMCSGSIISKDLVITAASCLQIAYANFRNPRSVFVRVGSDYMKSSGRLIPVTEVYFHPGYDPQSLRNNIVIVRIKRQIKLSSKKGKLRRIKYNKKIDKPIDGVYVLGWGAQNSRNNQKNLHQLAVDYLDLFNFHDCQQIYSSHYVTKYNFCAGFVDKGSGACNRDVGGPGILDGTLVGIISFGPPVCGMANSPTVFTNIGYFGTWIDSIVHKKSVLKISKPIPITSRSNQDQIQLIGKTRSRSLSNKFRFTTPFTTHSPSKASDDYPEEVKVLEEMLQEIVVANSSLVDYILNGDGEQETSIKYTKAYNDDNNHHVYNKIKNNRNFKVHHRITENDKHVHGFVDPSRTQLYGRNDLRQKSDEIMDEPAGHGSEVRQDNNIEYSDDTKSSDVSENYEEHSDHEHELAIDTTDFELKNITFLDVLFNLQQYQQSHFPNIQTDDKHKKDPISVQLFLSDLAVDTTPHPELIPKMEIRDSSYSDGDDEKEVFRADSDSKMYFSVIDPWQFTKEINTIHSDPYEMNFRGRNLPVQMNSIFGIPRANQFKLK